MSEDSHQKRERLKEEYKAHYRKIQETKERLRQAKRTQKITDALHNMDTTQLAETFDDFLFKVKSKVASLEARLDVAMDSLGDSYKEAAEEQQHEEELRKAKARETLKQAKIEMGMLYSEIEQQADALQVEKTIGRKTESPISPKQTVSSPKSENDDE